MCEYVIVCFPAKLLLFVSSYISKLLFSHLTQENRKKTTQRECEPDTPDCLILN